jgi:hypothetical protein
LIHKPFWKYFQRNPMGSFNRLVTMDETWNHISYTIQVLKNNPRLKDKVAPRVRRSSWHRSHQARSWCPSSGEIMEFCL